MTDTVRTDSYLTGTEFKDGQAAGSITPQDVRDLIVSKVNVEDVYDDYANALGLGAPAIINGHMYLDKCSGVVVGAGQTLSTRQANATAIQNAITTATNHGKWLEVVEGVYEYNSSTGIVVPAIGTSGPGLKLRGHMQGSQFVQYYNSASGAPAFTIGDTSSTGTSTNYADIEGLAIKQGGTPTGLTASANLVLGNMGSCSVKKLLLGQPSDQTNSPYNQVVTKCAATGAAVFSCSFADWFIHGTQNDMLQFNLPGSGNKWAGNIYMSNGPSGVYNAMSGFFINWNNVNDESLWDVVNMEWASVHYMVNAALQEGTRFDKMHIEGIKFTGSSPCVFFSSSNAWTIGTLTVTNPIIQTSNFTGSASLIQDWNGGSSVIDIEEFYVYYYTAGLVTTALRLYGYGGSSPADDHGIVTIGHGTIDDQTFSNALQPFIFFDDHMPNSSFVAPHKWESYSYGVGGSKVNHAVIPVSATYTHYGQHENSTITVPASITSFTITLSNLQGATGTQNVKTGTTTHIRRLSGTASGTLTVKDDAGTTLATNTTSAADLWFQFNGTHYVTFTPVS